MVMVVIRFNDRETERRALGFLAGRFSFKCWDTGEVAVHEVALPYIAKEGVRFSVEGPAPYERLIPSVRNPAAASL